MLLAALVFMAPRITVYGASIAVDATCSLEDANSNAVTGGCIAGTVAEDTITITAAGTTNGTITLSDQLIIEATTGSGASDSDIVIEGGGFAISGNDATRIFLVKSHDKLTINNLVLTNGSAGNGGAIKVDNDGNLTLDNVTVKDSEATSIDGGGGGLNAAASARVNIFNS